MRPIILILGPTAGGKTAISIDLARRLPGGGECISADSMQVYRRMNIGTAKPSLSERQGVTHHLIDLIDPSDDGFSVDTWLSLAEAAIRDIRSRNHWPIVVGGTNLYIKALLYGLMDGPEPDDELRARLNELDTTQLRTRLVHIDPAAADRIHANDRKRTSRAIEFFEQTGIPISGQQREWDALQPRSDARLIGLEYSAEVINKRINQRVREMFEIGLPEEVRRIWCAGSLGRQARQALGYKQLIEHFEGQSTLEDAIEKTKIETRRYAKNQRTWLKQFRCLGDSTWIHCDYVETQDIADQALAAAIQTPELPLDSATAEHMDVDE